MGLRLQKARAMRIAPLVLVIAGCAGATTRTNDPVAGSIHISGVSISPTVSTIMVEPIVQTITTAPTPEPAPSEPSEPVQTVVQFVRTTVLYKQPSLDADKVGVIRAGSRAIATAAQPGWIAIAPRGWAPDMSVENTDLPPSAATPHSLTDAGTDDDTPVVPGTYGTVHGAGVIAYPTKEDAAAGTNGRALTGTNSVRATAATTIAGKKFWRTSGGDWIPVTAIRRFSPSRFKGIAIAAGAAMPAWVRSHHDPKEPVVLRSAPGRGHAVARLERRTVVTVAEISDSGRFVRVTDTADAAATGWVARDDVRIAELSEPPPGVGATDKWFDVDLDDQVLVAYEGTAPVYATLVSTGRSGHRTPARITRVKSKLERATMSSNDVDVYSVADVPWTMYYDDPGFALHTSYWHDGFGGTRSHGCINLAPQDARALYHWSSPDVPPGWIAVYGDEDNPGSLVRVHSRKVPEPAFRGYARRMLDKERS